MESSKVCREKRGEILDQMKGITGKVKEEKRNLTKEECDLIDSLDKEQEALQAQAETFDRCERIEGLTKPESRDKMRNEVVGHNLEKLYNRSTEEQNNAIAGWFYHGSSKNKPEYWRAAERAGIDVTNQHIKFDWKPWKQPKYDQRSNPLESDNSAAGGFTVPIDYQLLSYVDVAMKYYGNVFQFATVIDTPTGASLPWLQVDDTAATAPITPQTSGIPAVSGLSFAQPTLNAYRYQSDIIKVSWEVMNDSVLDLSAFIGKRIGIRIGRSFNSDCIVNGAGGSNGPTPILTTASSGATAAATASIQYTDLTSLFHSVDISYRDEPGCGWLFADGFLKQLRNMVDNNGRPLLMSSLEGIALGLPRSLLEKPYYLNNAMPSVAHSNKAALFGDLSKIIVRRVTGGDEGGLHLIRLNERFADSGLVGYLGWARLDSLLSDAGQKPLKYLQMA